MTAEAGQFVMAINVGDADDTLMEIKKLNNQVRKYTEIHTNEVFARMQVDSEYKPTKEDQLPSINELEQTHILFTVAHFKPFATFSFIYQKTKATSPTAHFGEQIQYNLQQFGEFWADTVFHFIVAPITATAGVVPALTAAAVTGAGSATYVLTTHRYCGANGATKTAGDPAYNSLYYTNFPAFKAIKSNTFIVNGNELDKYGADSYICDFFTKVMPHKRPALCRLIGQEVPIPAISSPTTIYGVDGATDTSRRMTYVLNGFQTPKTSHPAAEWWVPSLFWFQKYYLAFPAVSVPSGQCYFQIELESLDKMIYKTYGDLYDETTVSTCTLTGVDTAPVTEVRSVITRTQVMATDGSAAVPNPNITPVEVYINNIFVDQDLHAIYMARIGFNIVRVHKSQVFEENVSQDDKLMNGFKFPVEYIYFGLRPTTNRTTNGATDWYKFNYNTIQNSNSYSASSVLVDLTGVPTAASKSQASQSVVESYKYQSTQDTVTTLSLSIHGIKYFDAVPFSFFTNYINYAFGEDKWVGIDNIGLGVITFALLLGIYQPSGHLDVSKARELYIGYTSTLVGSTVPTAQFYAEASAINFLMISEGNAVMRLAT